MFRNTDKELNLSHKSESTDLTLPYPATCKNTPDEIKQRGPSIPKKVTKRVYKYAEEAILKGIKVGSKTFKNYIINRIILKSTSKEIIEVAINNADYTELQERYIKNGKVIAKESQKYSLTLHAKERISKPDKDNVTHLFKKYINEAEQAGMKKDKEILNYLQEKIQPRNISVETVSNVIDSGKCVKLPGKIAEYTKDGTTVIVSRRDHSVITAYQDYTNKNPHTLHKTSCSLTKNVDISADEKQVESLSRINRGM